MLNRAIIMGRITRDPELKYTQSQIPVISFSVAVDRDFVKQGEQREADFINVTAWRSTAEFIAKWFQKGSMIVVDGKLQTRKWEDKHAQKRTEVEIVADNVYFGESKRSDNTAGTATAPAYQELAYQPPVPTRGEQSRFDFRNDFRPIDDDEPFPF